MKKDDFNVDNALSFEASVKSMVEKSNKRAWFITTISLILNFLLVLAILFLTPLKTVEPFVIKVDKNGIFQGVMQKGKDGKESMISIGDWNKKFKSDDNK